MADFVPGLGFYVRLDNPLAVSEDQDNDVV